VSALDPFLGARIVAIATLDDERITINAELADGTLHALTVKSPWLDEPIELLIDGEVVHDESEEL
jgi:hypothetical protein